MAADDGVGAELVDVLGGPMQPSAGADQSCVHPDGAQRPDLAVRAALGAEQFVEDSVGVSDDIKGESKVSPVGGQSFGGGEGDDGDPGVTELVEVVAHGDHVFLARQSSQVPVQDQHKWSATHLGCAPRPTLMVDEFDVGKRVADVEGHGVSPIRSFFGTTAAG